LEKRFLIKQKTTAHNPNPPRAARRFVTGRKEIDMNEICTTCNHWRGIHHWETMQCPVNDNEDGTFRKTTYTEESPELAKLRARNAELLAALEEIADGRNWITVNGNIVWNNFAGNEHHTEHASDLARAAIKAKGD
jgi:hypothetical protein